MSEPFIPETARMVSHGGADVIDETPPEPVEPPEPSQHDKAPIDGIMPSETAVELMNDDHDVIEIRPIMTREFFKLLRIVTKGAWQLIPTLVDATPEDLPNQILAALLMAIPNAENETMDFIQALAVLPDIGPTNNRGEPTTTKGKFNAEIRDRVVIYLDNPHLEDTMKIIEAVVINERGTMESLGNRFGRMLKLAEKTGQLRPNQ